MNLIITYREKECDTIWREPFQSTKESDGIYKVNGRTVSKKQYDAVVKCLIDASSLGNINLRNCLVDEDEVESVRKGFGY